MSYLRRRDWKGDLPRQFSGIYKMVLYENTQFVAFALPMKFASAKVARDFAERWNPNPSFRGTITTMSVCRSEYAEDRLKRYRNPPARPRILTLVETEKLSLNKTT